MQENWQETLRSAVKATRHVRPVRATRFMIHYLSGQHHELQRARAQQVGCSKQATQH